MAITNEQMSTIMNTAYALPAKQSATDIAKDIIAFVSVCIKMGFEESVNNQRLLVEMVNEAGLRTVRGEEFTYMGFRQMMARLPESVKKEMIAECADARFTETYIGNEEIETYEE